jgi:hypothetical protein
MIMKATLNNSQIKTVIMKISKEMTQTGNSTYRSIFEIILLILAEEKKHSMTRDFRQSVILVKGTDQELNHSIIDYYYYY